MGPKQISAEANLTGWLQQLMTDLDGALADFAHTLTAIENGTYTDGVSGQRFGLITVDFENPARLVPSAKERAANSCFMTAIGKFISFLDKLIASAIVHREGVSIDRNLSGDAEITAYLNDYMARKIATVAMDRSLTNPKKLRLFAIPAISKETALGYFALRRALEHHQGVVSEDIKVHVLTQKLFADDTEITGLPAHVSGGQTLQLRLVPETKVFPAGSTIILTSEDVHAILFTIRVSVAPLIFEAHIKEAGQPPTAPLQSTVT